MKLEILGPGCKRCQLLAENAQAAVAELGLEAEVVKVEDMQIIMSYGVMSTPALVVDGQVRLAGHIATPRQIREIISQGAP
jgi:small redox-active disulfide protein 2